MKKKQSPTGNKTNFQKLLEGVATKVTDQVADALLNFVAADNQEIKKIPIKKSVVKKKISIKKNKPKKKVLSKPKKRNVKIKKAVLKTTKKPNAKRKKNSRTK